MARGSFAAVAERVELPVGYSGWTKAGAPVRRVATSCDPHWPAHLVAQLDLPFSTLDLLAMDVYTCGDAWVDLSNQRVAPPEVVVERCSTFVKFRSDGWPLCPVCGEDELYSLAVPATVETIVGCYRCNWKP